MISFVQAARWVGVGVLMILLGACGMVGVSVGAHLYADHLLIDQARAADQQRVIQAAEQVKQYQQQQQQQAGPQPAAPAK